MSDEEYVKKLETLQQYIPFLDNMIQQLKDPTKKNREQQLAKMQSLHAMITDKKKKLKLETLVRCEDVISKLYEKVHNRPIGVPRKGLHSPILTPASPSPTREILAPKPLTIPTERLDGDRQKPKIDIYSSAAESLNRPRPYSGLTLGARVPDMSKPPISLEDLKTLEEDVQDKINESSLKTASLNELNNLREIINEQIQLEDIKTNSPQKTKKDAISINTTVRNNLILTKKTIQPPDKPKEKVPESPKSISTVKLTDAKTENSTETKKDVKITSPIVKPKDPKSEISTETKKDVKITSPTIKPKDPRSEISTETKKEVKITSPQISSKPKSPKILKEPASIFGSILSNIDDQILGGQKKKDERRNSFPGKEERRLSDAAKEKSKPSDKTADIKRKEERRSSSTGKQDKKPDDKKPGDSKKTEKIKSSSKDSKSKDKIFDFTLKKSLEENERKLKDNLEKIEDKTKISDGIKDAEKDSSLKDSGEKDATKDKPVISRISVKKDLELKSNKIDVPIQIMEESPNKTVFRRLADKYNPKPKKQTLDADVDQAVADSIEEKMKTSPPKIPVINQMPEPVPPPASLLISSIPEPEIPPPPSQLPTVLQNILHPNTTHLINSVVNHLRQTNAENEARKSPMVSNAQQPLLGNPPVMGNPPSLLGNPPSLLGNPPSLLGNPASVMGNNLVGSSPSLLGNPNLMSPPTQDDGFVSEYCREAFNTESNMRFTPPARPESRMRFEAPSGQEMMGNQLPNNQRFIPPALLGDRFANNFTPNGQFSGLQPVPDMYGQPFGYNQNQVEIQPLDYYPPNAPVPPNQYNCGPPLLSPEVPHYHNEQKPAGFGLMMNNDFFGHNEDGGHWRNMTDDRFNQWDRRDQDLRMSRDPRTYREYREMRDARDPRVANNRDPREPRDSRDPRINRDPRDRDNRDSRDREPRDREYRDPRVNRGRDNDRERSNQRDSRSQSRDYRSNRYDSKFDRVYSRTNRERSRSRSRPRDTFTSPLDSLYSGKEDHRTGKGYGVQNFRIPKIKKEDETKEKEEENSKVSSTNEDLIEAVDMDIVTNDTADSDDEECIIEEGPKGHEEADQSKTEETKDTDTEQVRPKSTTPQLTEPQEAETIKVTSSEPAEPEAKPADQTILAHFFANLLGSKNKRDKKTALYSLISTFSDSFSEKELSKITKIIKANDEDDDTSEEEEEPKKVAQKPDEEKEAPKDETVEETEKEDIVKTPKPKARRRIRRLSSSSPTKEDKNKEIEAVKSTEPEIQPQEPEAKMVEEGEDGGVIVSVGERIKSRKRHSVSPPKPKKKCRTELDMLHEDIQDMFIRDGVLTASGKRMCRILKGDPDVLSAVQQSKATLEETPKLRRRPMPKCKQKGPNAAEVKVMKSVRVVIPKIPDGNSTQTEESPKRNLRRSARNVAYAESDDEIPTREETPTVQDDSVLEDQPLREVESDVDSSDSDKEKSTQPADNQKSKIIKRKRGKSWASGVIPSNKKKKKKQSSFDESEKGEDNNKEADKSIESIADSDPDKSYIEPDKNYYVDVVTSKSHHCKLCSYHGRFITTHYKTLHPLSEILTSRFSPAIAAEAIKDTEKNLAKYESLFRIKGGVKIRFTCRFCEFNTHVPPTMFYDHITTHTGEYRHICPMCEFSASSGKTLKSHMSSAHKNDVKRVARKTYGQTIMFGYMCGECNYVQLSKTNVEEHINIFHLQKPTIYKVNLSTYVDPELEKIATEEGSTTNTDEVTPPSAEDKRQEEAKQKKVEVEKPPEVKETPPEPKKMPPPQRKKPGPKAGPKSRKMLKEKTAQKKKDVESDSATDSESAIRTDTESVDSRNENKEVVSDQNERPVPVSTRRLTRETSVEEEASPVRSRRAAKDKATEKLKTLMEASEGPPRKKSLTGDEAKRNEDKTKKDTVKSKPVEVAIPEPPREEPKTDKKPDDDNIKEVSEVKTEKCEPEKPPAENKPEEIKSVVKKEVEMNVFTCKTDLQEENKKIEQERLQLMDELNKSVGSRTSLNFVDKLCTRLNQSDVEVKQEPRDDTTESFNRATRNQSPLVMPVLQKEKLVTTPTPVVPPPVTTPTVTPNKKPILEPEAAQAPKSSYDVTQKNDKIITDMIQKLKGKLATIIDEDASKKPPSSSMTVTLDDNDYDSEGPPPLTHVNELVNVKPTDGSTKTLLIGGFMKVIKNSESLMFSCLVPPCVFSTEKKDDFQLHCKEVHRQSNLNRQSTLCELCGLEIASTTNCTLLENLFKHVITEHTDFINNEPEPSVQEPEPSVKPPNRVLRIRKLSGDALSVIKKDWDELIPIVGTVDNTDDDVEASAVMADEETDKEHQVEPIRTDEPATMVELDMSEDNPFPFKISGVMSLATEQPSLPPLAPLVKPVMPISSLQTGAQLIVKEAKLSQAELQKPRKTAKAMAKFIASVSDLYKCPHYYCLFSTNFRDFLERHLKAHKVEQDIMIPCVYCDMKTPWEHVPMHIDIRHAHCRFACSYCLYRAVAKEYVFLHQDQVHPASDYSVIALPQPKHSKKFAIADIKVDPKTLCEPYRCLWVCNAEFLFENEFKRHLQESHKTSFISCGYKGCTNRVQSTKMANHWALTHGVCVYQCGFCKTGSNELAKMYHHFAQAHPGLPPNILIRILTPILDQVTLGYSPEAMKMMRKVVTIPSNILDQTKVESKLNDSAAQMVLPVPVQYGKQPPFKPAPLTKTTLQMVTALPQTNQKSLLIPKNTSSLKGTITLNAGTSNLLLFPSSSAGTSLGTIVMAAPSPLITSVAPVNKATVQVVPSLESIPTPSISGITDAPAPKEKDASIENDGATQDNQLLTIEPLEHITVGDDNQLALDETDNGDIDPLSLDCDMNDTAKDGDSSGDESDGSKIEKSKKTSKCGLLSYQLYRCAFCDISFSNPLDFKRHATRSLTCRKEEGTGKQFVCVHCTRKLKNPNVLVDHIQTHGVLRFSCSLCSNKYPTANQARSHVKTRHNINQTSLTPVNPTRTNLDIDEYIIRPKLVLQSLLTGEATPSEPFIGASSTENVYTPDQIDKIPMRHILSSSIRCGLCSYNTKVRTNMVRHLQFHLEEKAVSESAPVNPVPCLEKNEKMFDKMVNLASSSHTTSRMGGTKPETKEKEAENLPEFVQTHCRYVCPAQGCNYLCPEEANLRHHIIALHDSETAFTCVHCKASLAEMDADNLIKHFKLHGLQLYKCQYCSFMHNLKHKVEKHTGDVHLDLPCKVVTVRCLEAEPQDQEPSTSGAQALQPPPPAKVNKPWRCCMCKYKSGSLEGIRQHVLEKHEIDGQFKCALCTYKNDDTDSFVEHFKEAHDNQTVDIIYAYRKFEDKEKESETFDTTPLWQRDRPRVRHIRGILFDESSPVVSKSPKKASKTAATPASPGPSGVKPTTPLPSPSTSKNTNLDLSIESVANGTAGILNEKPSTIAEEFVELVNKYAKDCSDVDEEKVEEDKEDDVIVIDDDEEGTPLVKNKDNKKAPVAKNRPAKRKGAEVPGITKLARVSEVIDLDGAGSDTDEQDEYSERNLKLAFAGFGTPLNRQLKCPVCNQFKSKRISDFIFHMFKEMKVYRFKCKICSDESITFRYMYKHVQEHTDVENCDENIIFLPPNRKLEAWLQMVIREQSRIILQNFSPTPDDNVPSSKKIIACPHCDRKYQTEQERNEHSIAHWALTPFGCKKCKFSAYSSKEALKHVETAHAGRIQGNNAQQYVASLAPTVAKELSISDTAHMKEVNSVHVDTFSDENPAQEDVLCLPESSAPIDVEAAPPIEASSASRDAMDLSDNDLVIVTKTDSNVPDENDVFCCEYCPFMTNSETLVLSHITSIHEHMHIKFKTLNKVRCAANVRDFVGCMICSEIGSEIRIRQHHLDAHDGQTFITYRFTCSLCSKKFLKTTGLKMHFKKQHTGFPLRYIGLDGKEEMSIQPTSKQASASAATPRAPTPAPSRSNRTKLYSCPLCPYERVFQPNHISNVRAHVRQHFKAFACGLCPSHKFKSRWEAISHFSKDHQGMQEEIISNQKVNDEYNEMMAQIIRDAKPVNEPDETPKNTARKSTSAQFRRVEEYSFYGNRPEPVDLSKISTAVEINGMTLTMTAEKLSKIFDLNAGVVVEDCNLPVNLTTLFDS